MRVAGRTAWWWWWAAVGCSSSAATSPPRADAAADVAADVVDEGAADAAADVAVDGRPDVAADAPPDLGCTPGATCGNDCLPSDAPCGACGTLTYDRSCACVPPAGACPPATGCDNPAPAGEGEFCGTYRWCNRACAAGLRCTGAPPGPRVAGDYRRVCERATDGGAGDGGDAGAATFRVTGGGAGSFACGTRTCGPGQVCVRDCSGIDAGAVDLHRCAEPPADCRASGRCPCSAVCFTGQCTQETSGVVACTLCA